MQAVILAAGKSTRTFPLTLTKPKALLKILNKTILEHLLDALLECDVEETIVVVGYKKEMITERFGNEYKGMKLTYVEQKEQLGTMHSLHSAKHLLKDRFFALYGDDLIHADDLKQALKHEYSLAVLKTENPERFGIVTMDKDGFMTDMVEKPKEFIGDLASVGGFVFDMKIFDYEMKMEENLKEYFIPTVLREFCKDHKVKVNVIKKYWLPTGYPWDLLNTNEFLIEEIEESIDGEVENGVTIKGKVVIGKDTVVKAGAYIEGPVVIGEACVIGPNCFLRKGTTIGNNCKIGNAVEIKNSIIMDNTNVRHLSYIGDSILGDNVNIGAGTITANLRHLKDNVKSMSKGELVDTGRRKLGVILADGAKTGINTSFYPGRKMNPNTTTVPGEIVKKDVE